MIAVNADTVLLLYDDPEVPVLVVVLALSGPLAAASGLLLAILRRKLAFRELSIVVLVSSSSCRSSAHASSVRASAMKCVVCFGSGAAPRYRCR
ncbi:MAG: hypothetical protein JRE45_21035 [Deltaproteobacteria bacterium]|nr:hypothetical protein [Deltaproteobacteria bacterium]